MKSINLFHVASRRGDKHMDCIPESTLEPGQVGGIPLSTNPCARSHRIAALHLSPKTKTMSPQRLLLLIGMKPEMAIMQLPWSCRSALCFST